MDNVDRSSLDFIDKLRAAVKNSIRLLTLGSSLYNGFVPARKHVTSLRKISERDRYVTVHAPRLCLHQPIRTVRDIPVAIARTEYRDISLAVQVVVARYRLVAARSPVFCKQSVVAAAQDVPRSVGWSENRNI